MPNNEVEQRRQSFLSRAEATYRPVGVREKFFVEHMAHLEWRLGELKRMLSACLAADIPWHRQASIHSQLTRLYESSERNLRSLHKELLAAQKARFREQKKAPAVPEIQYRYVQ